MNKGEDFYARRMLGTGFSFILFGIGGILLGVLVFPVTLLLSNEKARGQKRCREMVRHSFRLFIRTLRGLGLLTYTIEGEEHLGNPGELIIANHPSLIDIVILMSILPDAKCIVKSELLRNPIMWGPLTCTGYISNERGEHLIRDCIASLETGSCLVIFPEGSRTEIGTTLRFKRGAAHIAIRSKKVVRLVQIKCEPPALRKQDEWYQIPSRRPHFTLTVQQNADSVQNSTGTKASLTARALTTSWQSILSQEINL